MKKLFTILLLMIAVCVNAQHMKFMNIPLDGTIDNFQAKLAQKGIKPDRAYNAKLPSGSRLFNGTFCGYKATFHAYYNTKTKVVYRCKACIEKANKEIINRLYTEIKSLLQSKYNGNYDEEDGTLESHESYALYINNNPNATSGYDYLGRISLYVSEYTADYLDTSYTLHIDYEDIVNTVKNDNIKSDDL